MKSEEQGVAAPEWVASLRNWLEELSHPLPGAEGKRRLMEVLAELGNLLKERRSEMPNELVHYLERRSYEKAVQYCAGGFSIPRGSCGPKHLG